MLLREINYMLILNERHVRVQIHDWIMIIWITHNEYTRETQTQISLYIIFTEALVRFHVKILENSLWERHRNYCFLFQIFEAIVTPEFCLHCKVHNFGNISFSTSHKAHKSIMVFRPELVTKTVHHKGRLPEMYSMFQNTLDELFSIIHINIWSFLQCTDSSS